jgi:hypothetical protein
MPFAIDDDNDARMRLVANGSVDVHTITVSADAALHGATGLVAPDGGEQMDLGVTPAELREGDSSAARRCESRVRQVDDRPRLDGAIETTECHVLDVADHCETRRGHWNGTHPRQLTVNA